MTSLFEVPISSVMSLTAENSVSVLRAVLRGECGYARLNPSALTLSSRITVADGGVDALVDASAVESVPVDCIFGSGLTGFQIKSGASFKPWTRSSIRAELINSEGRIFPEVADLVRNDGTYVVVCTGHDLTPEQRRKSKSEILGALNGASVPAKDCQVEVLGASQVVDFVERYPGARSLLADDLIEDFWTVSEWANDAHMSNRFAPSPEQSEVIDRVRAELRGEAKHIRVLGEPGLGKTRAVLEAVSAPDLSPSVLYLQHGSEFGKSRLFKTIIRKGRDKPLILVIDELPEREMVEVWPHLKSRCGALKLISLDHGRDETRDDEIVRMTAPNLTDSTIREILVNQVGESNGLDRWVEICGGSPRVAQAVAENLIANPGDVLRPPATVSLWPRYLHGYGARNDDAARQMDCVAQHLALFSRFGYEPPVASEAGYISGLINSVDPTIGWARFQEIVEGLRARRVLQGSRTLFFVPKALHIHLWKQFWSSYGRRFDFNNVFEAMPESLHSWFMSMFKYADGTAAEHVVHDILKHDGVLAEKANIQSPKGAKFISILAEAHPVAVLRFLEGAFESWVDAELLAFSEARQNIVWALEKIAVWRGLTVRVVALLSRFATNENSDYSNNSSGTLVALFRIGPEMAVTEASPQERLPALVRLLSSQADQEKLLGLKAVDAALESRGGGFRIVGAEYQGLRERASLWRPETYGEWRQAKLLYFEALVSETATWPSHMREQAASALLEAVQNVVLVQPCTELAFTVLDALCKDESLPPRELNRFFMHWRQHEVGERESEIVKRIARVERAYLGSSLEVKFRRYVIDVDWAEWDEDFREKLGRKRYRSKALVAALASRVARSRQNFERVLPLFPANAYPPAMHFFGESLAVKDDAHAYLDELVDQAADTRHEACLSGYLAHLSEAHPALHQRIILDCIGRQDRAGLGVAIALRFKYDDVLFEGCLRALELGWVPPTAFEALSFGQALKSLPLPRVEALFRLISAHDDIDSKFLLIELLDDLQFNDEAPFSSGFVFACVRDVMPVLSDRDTMRGFYWKRVCEKLIEWKPDIALPLLDQLLHAMGNEYRLSYDYYVRPLADEIVRVDPERSWGLVCEHFESSLPEWRHDLISWLKGGLPDFDSDHASGVIAEIPVPLITRWIDVDIETRATLVAHAAPNTFEEQYGGELTRELLNRYGSIRGVRNGISANFFSGGFTGRRSVHLRGKRDRFRTWLSRDLGSAVSQWIEEEIEDLDQGIEREEINEERDRFD